MMNLKTKVAGRYKLEAVKIVDGEEIRRPLTGWFDNLITNSGLDNIVTSWQFMYRCVVGTSNTAPSNSDTALGNQVGATTTVKSQTNEVNSTSPYYHSFTKVFRFGAGVAAGNLSEVGITDFYSPYKLFSRALILDSYGSPTTITVLSDEYLDVTYELRYYPLETDVTGSITFTGNIGGTYSYTIRQASIGSLVRVFGDAAVRYPAHFNNKEAHYYSADAYYKAYTGGSLGLITGTPSGTSLGDLPYTDGTGSYTDGEYVNYLTITATPDYWNDAGGISTILFPWGMRWYQVQFSPAIPKTDEDKLTLTFSHSFSRR